MILSHSKYYTHTSVSILVSIAIVTMIYLIYRLRLSSSNVESLNWPKNLRFIEFRKLVGRYCATQGWKLIEVSFRALEADFYVEKDGVRFIIACLSPSLTRRGVNASFERVLLDRLNNTRKRFSEPILYIYQDFIRDPESLRDRGLLVLPYTKLPDIMQVALHGTLENTCDGTWQRVLIKRLVARCRAISESCAAAGELQHAIDWAILATQSAPRDSRAQIRLGELYLKAGNLVEAERAGQKSVQLAPASSAPLWLLIVIKGRLGDEEGSIEYARRWVNIRSKHATAHKFLIELLLRYKKYSSAASALQTAVKILPDDVVLRGLAQKIPTSTSSAD